MRDGKLIQDRRTYPKVSGEEIADGEWLVEEYVPAIEEQQEGARDETEDCREGLADRLVWIRRRFSVVG